jgi:predicted CoA-binding protein
MGVLPMNAMQKLEILLNESGDRNNPGPERIKEIMESVRSIAVIGISRNPEKPARRVPSYLAAKGYEVIPINPFVQRILGKEARDSLNDVTEAVDMVLVFRPSEEAAGIVETAMARPERPVIWLQQGIRADDEANIARARGVTVVQDLCTFEVHKALA